MSRRKPRESALSIGLAVFVTGLAFLLAPGLLKSGPFSQVLQAQLRTPGFLALGLGSLLIALHFIISRRSVTSASAKPARRSTPAQGAPRTAPAYDQEAVRRILDGEGKTGAGPEAGVAPASDTAKSDRPHERLTQWSADVFQAIEWRRFEAVCEVLFAQAGFETRTQSHGPDGGVDIWLHSRHATGPVGVVQCKHWHHRAVPVGAVREFLGAMAAHKVTRGTYVRARPSLRMR